jgi:hypothetical protein
MVGQESNDRPKIIAAIPAYNEVPASCIYHSQSSTLNPVTHGLVVAFDVIKHRLLGR